jgi:uncharacterized protein YbjT (DUF2867 family)
MNDRTVTVFGGTGFLGRRVVRHLRKHGFSVQIASRHPDRGHTPFGLDPQIQSVEANIHDERSVADALAGAFGVVNAVSLYVEHGQETFHSVHVESAKRVAAQAHRAGVERLAHVSGNDNAFRIPFASLEETSQLKRVSNHRMDWIPILDVKEIDALAEHLRFVGSLDS